jgi:23S rRNA pseudouridine1911/1915/1917 synthase
VSDATEQSARTFVVTEADAGTRLDRYLAAAVAGLSRTRAQALIAAGAVRVDGRPTKASQPLEFGQAVALDRESAPAGADGARALVPEDIPVPIVYEDEHLIVLDKPAGLVVHPAPGHSTGTLVHALLGRLAATGTGGDTTRPGIVHRLDKDTSGLLVVARDEPTLTALAAQMKARRTVKRYVALVEGHMPIPEGAIEAPIGRDPRQRQRMALVSVPAGGREAVTRFRVLGEHRGRSLLEVQLETGRTHQIRVHLAAVGHPIVGDQTYGRPQPPQPPRQFLHAAHLAFEHPVTGAWMTFDTPLPDDLAAFRAEWER